MSELLKKAKAEALRKQRVPAKSACTDDDAMALALAWVRGEVEAAACSRALGMQNTSQVYPVFARGLRAAVERGVLVEAGGRDE